MKAALLFLLLSSVCHSRVSVTVTPSWSQYFEYEQVSVGCEQWSSGEWTVWRYTQERLKLSPCGSGWGEQTFSTCDIKTVKLSDNGVYWCESKYGDSSNAVNITVTDKRVILQSPVHPVTEGDDVILRCRTKTSSSLPAVFYRNNHLIGRGLQGQIIIRHFSKSHEGLYTCRIGDGESPPSWLLMKDDSDPASLTASPDSSQLFEYENLCLSCGDNSSLHGWKVMRSTTPAGKISSCGDEWGDPTFSGCVLHTTKQPDTATYWCESPARQRSNSLNIDVYEATVVLRSPVLAVMEGDNVTLHCRTKKSSNLSADFYKGDALIGRGPQGHMTIHHVSTSDEGLYRCGISSEGESPHSRLLVRDPHGRARYVADWTQSVVRWICRLVVISPFCVSTVRLVSVFRHRPRGRNKPVSMTTSPPGEDDVQSDGPYDDVIADVTTEHNF